MNHSRSGANIVRLVLLLLAAMVLASCGGGGGVPYTGVTTRPLSQEFITRKAVAYSPYRTAASVDDLPAEVIPKANIKQDLDLLLAAGYRLIRLFDSSDKVARQTLEVIRDNNLNIKVQLGAFVLGNDEAASLAEIERWMALLDSEMQAADLTALLSGLGLKPPEPGESPAALSTEDLMRLTTDDRL